MEITSPIFDSATKDGHQFVMAYNIEELCKLYIHYPVMSIIRHL